MNLEERLLEKKDTSFPLEGKRLLVVDDSLDTRILFTLVLEEYGAEVIAVESAAEALDAVEHLKPHLLISDITLEGEDGYSLIRKVRSLDPDCGGHIPAIAVTGLYEDQRSTGNASTEFQFHLTKPVDPNTLVTTAAVLIELGTAA